MRYAISTLLFASLLTQVAAAQSKEETEKFILEKLNGYKHYFFRVKYTLSFHDGKMAMISDYSDRKTTGTKVTTKTVNLADLNPANVKTNIPTRKDGIKEYNVQLFATGEKKTIDEKVVAKDGWEHFSSDRYNWIYLHAKDERTMNQVAKAFRHLIKLYGGKEELFEE